MNSLSLSVVNVIIKESTKSHYHTTLLSEAAKELGIKK